MINKTTECTNLKGALKTSIIVSISAQDKLHLI